MSSNCALKQTVGTTVFLTERRYTSLTAAARCLAFRWANDLA